MKRSKRVTERDYQDMLRLACEMGEITDTSERRKVLLTRMGAMFGTSCNLICRTGWVNGAYTLLDHQLEDDGRMQPAQRRAYFSGDIPVDPMALYMEPQKPGHAALRVEGLSDALWYQSPHYQDCRRALKLNDSVYGKIVSRNGNVYGIAFVRDENDGLLGSWHREMLHVFNTTLAPMLDLDRWQQDIGQALSPQLRAIARCYMAGMSAKQAARKLGLADSTVREYTKIMHRRLNVSSRGELLALLFKNEEKL